MQLHMGVKGCPFLQAYTYVPNDKQRVLPKTLQQIGTKPLPCILNDNVCSAQVFTGVKGKTLR